MSVLKEYFNFSKYERRGIFVLLVIIMLLLAYNQFMPCFVRLPQVDYTHFREEVHQFLQSQEALKKEKLIEINTADTAALISLPGIGPYFAKRIIKYRALLGGFYKKTQLLEVYGMDSNRYQQFKESIIIDTSRISRIRINQVEFRGLLRHPYFDYALVKCIFNHRQKKKNIGTIEELKDLDCVNDSIFLKIKPYVSLHGNE